MLVHDRADDLVLLREFLLQRLYLALELFLPGRTSAALQHLCSFLEELLLPAIEHRRVEPVAVTHIRDRRPLQQVLAQDRDLLLR